MQYALGLIIPVISYFIQIFPRLFNRYFGVDVWTLLIEAELIRKNKHKIPKEKITDGFILDGYFDYPPLFLILLSFFSKKSLFKLQGLISPFFDALQNFLVFLIAYQLSQNVTMAILAQVVYTLIPISALENSSLLSRSMGYLLFTLSFYFAILYATVNPANFIFLMLSLLFSALTLLTHKFATQSLFFVVIFFSILEGNPVYLFIFFTAIILALILSKGYYARVLKSHLNIVSFWFKNYKLRFAHQVYGEISISKNPDLIGIIYRLLTKLAPITLLASNIWILSSLPYLFKIIPIANPIYLKMAIWVAFFYILGILVLMVKRLTCIGEGYRYLEMATVPCAILTSYLFLYLYNFINKNIFLTIFISLLLLNLLTILFVQIKAVIKDKNRSMTENMKKTFSFINKLKGMKRIMCIPHQITTMVVYNTNAQVLVNFDFDPQTLNKMNDFYPIFKKPIQTTIRRYAINYILLRTSFSKPNDLKLSNYKVIFESGDVSLLRI